MNAIKTALTRLLRRSERYTKTDMVYLARSGIFSAGSDIILSLLSLGLAVLIAAYVPKETFGIYRYILSLAAVALAVSLTGMNSSVTRAVALGRDGAVRASLRPQLKFAMLQGALIALVAAYYVVRGNMDYGIALSFVALVAPLSAVFNTYAAYLNGKAEFGRIAIFKVQAGIINVAAMAAVVLLNPTAIWLTVAYFLSTCVVNLWFLRKTLARIPKDAPAEGTDISYGKHLSAMNSLGMVSTQLDAILLYHLFGPVTLAVYSFAILIPERFRSFLSFLPSAALPRLASRSPEEIKATLMHRLGWFFAATLCIAVAYAILAPYLFRELFPRYADAIPYTQLAGLFAITTVTGYLSTALTALKMQRELYVASFVTLAAKVVLSVGGILAFGVAGAIAARILAAAVNGALNLRSLQRAR